MDMLLDVMLDKLRITPEILRMVAEIDEFKGQWLALGSLAPERLSALRRVATIESIGSSTRIEGVRLSDAEIEAVLAGVEPRSFRSRDEQEVAGYAAAMELVFESWREISLTENHLKQIHGVLLKYSEKDQRHRGKYKTLPNSVIAVDARGRSLGVIFETASPFDTPRLMSELVEWGREEVEGTKHHPLMVIATFVVRFLAIHPFQDGNGRLSRVLTTLLLLRADYGYVPYSSLERVIEDNKRAYYRALRAAQGDPSKVEVWVTFFLRCLIAQKDALVRRIGRERVLAAMTPLDEELVKLARAHGRLTVRMAVSATGKSRNTIKGRLRHLVDAGHLLARGERRGAWYEPAASDEAGSPNRLR